MFALMSSVVGFAQLSEVKGVETKLVVYDGSEYNVKNGSSRNGNSLYKYSTKWFGYSFYNMNSIPVSVEAELYKTHDDKHFLVTTKTFNLKPGETYIWKHENMAAFQVNYDDYIYGHNDYWTESKEEPNYYDSGRVTYYIRYKAYKIL